MSLIHEPTGFDLKPTGQTGKMSEKGFTLIEVLVAVLVLAIGLLGLAALQTTAMKNNQSAFYRSQATQLAYDMADRMRVNLANAQLYNGSTYITLSPTSANAQAGCTAIANACTAAQMAQQDLFEWNRDITSTTNGLPSGVGTIAVSGTIYTITINWDDNRDGVIDTDNTNSVPDDPNFQMSFQL